MYALIAALAVLYRAMLSRPWVRGAAGADATRVRAVGANRRASAVVIRGYMSLRSHVRRQSVATEAVRDVRGPAVARSSAVTSHQHLVRGESQCMER